MLKQLMTMKGMLTTTFLVLLAGAAYVDVRKRKIPDLFVVGIFLTALAGMLCLETPGIFQRAAGTLAISVPMLLISLYAPGAFGGGDIKLMAACGMFLGAEDIFYSFFYALVLGGLYGLYLIFYKNKSGKTEFAFGPFLAAGILLRLIFRGFFC